MCSSPDSAETHLITQGRSLLFSRGTGRTWASWCVVEPCAARRETCRQILPWLYSAAQRGVHGRGSRLKGTNNRCPENTKDWTTFTGMKGAPSWCLVPVCFLSVTVKVTCCNRAAANNELLLSCSPVCSDFSEPPIRTQKPEQENQLWLLWTRSCRDRPLTSLMWFSPSWSCSGALVACYSKFFPILNVSGVQIKHSQLLLNRKSSKVSYCVSQTRDKIR